MILVMWYMMAKVDRMVVARSLVLVEEVEPEALGIRHQMEDDLILFQMEDGPNSFQMADNINFIYNYIYFCLSDNCKKLVNLDI